MNRPSSSGSSIEGLYERELVVIFQPAFAKRLLVDSSRLPFGSPIISNGFGSDTRPSKDQGGSGCHGILGGGSVCPTCSLKSLCSQARTRIRTGVGPVQIQDMGDTLGSEHG